MGDRSSDSETEEPTISEDVVVTKYKMAGDMANRKFVNCFVCFFRTVVFTVSEGRRVRNVDGRIKPCSPGVVPRKLGTKVL